MDEQTELLREMRDLLRVMAEPALAKRDEKLRTVLLKTVGKSPARIKSIFLMDGTRTQKVIRETSKIDPGDLSRLVKSLHKEGLIALDEKKPKLALAIPSDFLTARRNGDGQFLRNIERNS
jgi:hypothetical protein